ncbi:hypothetical protein ACHAWT_007708 [Skeletonema menzelii]
MASKRSVGSAFQAIASSLCELGITTEAKKKDDDTSQKEQRFNNHVQEFFQNVWQAQPAIFRSCQDASLDKDCPLFKAVNMNWNDVAQMLHHCRDSSSHAPLFFQNGNPITDPTTTYANNPHAAYLDGCSIIVNHADFHHPIIANLCSSLQQTFPHVYANTYLSPPDSHAVNAHADDRDVLVVQLLGSKTWKVYRKVPIQYPFENEQVGKNGLDVDPSVFAGGLCFDDKEITLSAGDVLYMPRGFVHEASTHTHKATISTTNESIEPSFHITLALATHDWCMASILSDTIRKTLIDNPEFRKALPIGPCSEYGGSRCEADGFLKQQLDGALSLIKANVTSELLHEQLTNKYAMHNSRADELRQNINNRKRPRQDQREDDCVGYHAACRLTLNSLVRASSTEERNSVVLEEGRLRGLTVREETMQSLMTIIGLMKEELSLQIRVGDLRNITTADESICSNPLVCDFTLLSFARCCVELGAMAVVT